MKSAKAVAAARRKLFYHLSRTEGPQILDYAERIMAEVWDMVNGATSSSQTSETTADEWAQRRLSKYCPCGGAADSMRKSEALYKIAVKPEHPPAVRLEAQWLRKAKPSLWIHPRRYPSGSCMQHTCGMMELGTPERKCAGLGMAQQLSAPPRAEDEVHDQMWQEE